MINFNRVSVDVSGTTSANVLDELLLGAAPGAITELDLQPQDVLYARTTELLAGGRLVGPGTISGNLLNLGGVVAPGPSVISSGVNYAGHLSVQGYFVQDALGTLQLRVAGIYDTAELVQYDQLFVGGVADLDGTVAISTLDPADPIGNSHPYLHHFGDTFDVLTAAQIKNDGFVIQAPPLSNGLGYSWAIITGANGLQTLRLTIAYQPPVLSIQTTGSQVQITWPSATFPYFALQSATHLVNADWVEVPVSTKSFNLSPVAGAKFYRSDQAVSRGTEILTGMTKSG